MPLHFSRWYRSLSIGSTLLLTAFQIVRLLVFIDVHGGIEHDGGWLLTVSRSLAERGAYTTMVSTIIDPHVQAAGDIDLKFDIQDPEGRILFFTGNGIGPASIVPDALIIRLFGSGFWALRLGPLLFYALMLLLAARIVYALAGLGAVMLLHGFLFFYPNLSIFLGYEAMGEVPTMAYILLAYLVFAHAARDPDASCKRYVAAGIVAGLAVNAKFIGLLSISSLFAYALGAGIAAGRQQGRWFAQGHVARMVALGAATLVVPLLWELIQFITIVLVANLDTYVQHLSQRWKFVLDDGSGIGLQSHSGPGFIADKFFVLSEVAHPERWVTALIFLAILAGGAWLGWRARHAAYQRSLLAVVWLGWLANSVWFVGLAKTGWVRHDWFGLILAAMLIAVITVALIADRADRAHNPGAASARWRGGVPRIAGLALLGLVAWGFVSQPHTLSLTVPDELISDWQQKQILDPYGGRLPWIVIPRTDQSEVAAFMQSLPTDSHVYFWGGDKTAELAPLSGRINYPLARRELMGPQARDVLVLGPSVISPWMSPENRRIGLRVFEQQCRRPLIVNDYYRLCGLDGPTASGVPNFTPVGIDFKNGIRLLGYDTYKTSYRPGESLQVSLFWQSAQPVNKRYKAFIQLVGAVWNPETNNPLWGQRDQDPGDGSRLTTAWTTGTFTSDPHLFRVAANAPPGVYEIQAGMYDAESGQRLEIVTKDGSADHVVLFAVSVQP